MKQKFEYQAIDSNGNIVRGIVEATEIKTVFSILLHEQLHPMDIRPLTETTVELSRLNDLKQRLEGNKSKKEQPKKQQQIPEYKPKIAKPHNQIDWSYMAFIILVVSIIAASVFAG